MAQAAAEAEMALSEHARQAAQTCAPVGKPVPVASTEYPEGCDEVMTVQLYPEHPYSVAKLLTERYAIANQREYCLCSSTARLPQSR